MLITELKNKDVIKSLLGSKVFVLTCHGCREIHFPEHEADELIKELSDSGIVTGSLTTDYICNAENLIWNAAHAAQHLGIKDGWSGTGEIVEIAGKNIISKIIIGTKDLNALLLNDNSSGDALFLDDQFSANGDQQRLAFLDEIQAGAGDDVIDLTSQKFEYAFKDSLTIRGGNGDDVIWANSGHNIIFGDKGNDRIVGGRDDDTIIGGAGDDSMHGGGGNDTFYFGGNFGNDTVEQLSGGKVTLRFDYDSGNWNAETMTYSNGLNSVKVTGITADQVELFFGAAPDTVDKAFADFSSEKVYDKDNILNMIVG